ncbi:MAG: type II toxin-antitoxin system RelE/ParE family toxin [Deltaproteobacteria bacterium]|nr:type II toxin-antitoxin system RelE/ParE family toxin [Deltaproteobacteria bacterium]
MIVKWTKRALENLIEEARYIAERDPDAADRTLERIGNAVKTLAQHPAIGRPGRVAGTQELVIAGTPYIIPYRVRGQQVEILRVFHSSRKWPRQL